jgi:hypothetical protein
MRVIEIILFEMLLLIMDFGLENRLKFLEEKAGPLGPPFAPKI